MKQGSGASKPLVYDIGMNQGQNIPYYLSKGCRVVAVEAAPPLVDDVRSRFAADIEKGDLTVLNLGISNDERHLPFYFNSEKTVLSSFVPPRKLKPSWTVIEVPTIRISKLLRDYGFPHFLKIDIEGYDHLALLDLLKSGIVPPSLSVEVHRVDVLCALIALGYGEFQLVSGPAIGRSISHCRIRRVDGSRVEYDFPPHSAGPFGDDLGGEWLTADAVLEEWLAWRKSGGGGWVDAHAQAPSGADNRDLH